MFIKLINLLIIFFIYKINNNINIYNNIMDSVYKFFGKIDETIGPSKKDYKPACHEDREMLLECVL